MTGVGGGEFSVAVTVHLTANSVVSLPSDLSASGGVNQQETAVIGLGVGIAVLFFFLLLLGLVFVLFIVRLRLGFLSLQSEYVCVCLFYKNDGM